MAPGGGLPVHDVEDEAGDREPLDRQTQTEEDLQGTAFLCPEASGQRQQDEHQQHGCDVDIAGYNGIALNRPHAFPSLKTE